MYFEKSFIFVSISLILLSSKVFCQNEKINQGPQRVIQFSFGKTFLQPKRIDENPTRSLSSGEAIDLPHPFALVAGKNSLLEVHQKDLSNSVTLRIGRSTALEFKSLYSLSLYQGSVLITHRQDLTWKINSTNSQFSVRGDGTWMTEKTSIGFKFILLEGSMNIIGGGDSTVVEAGNLILINDEEGNISQKLKIELPLLLSTSRLLNRFPDPLPSQSRLISAAQVQALRTKKKYEAMIGGVSENRKLEIWQVGNNQEK